MTTMKQKIALLGSTGSIGEQTLDIVRVHNELFEVTVLSANNNWQRLAQQAIEYKPDSVVIANADLYAKLRDALAPYPIKVYAGQEALLQVLQNENIDTVVNAIVGYAGMLPSLAAVSHHKRLALANKESLVVAGEHIMRVAQQNGVPVIPVDSEHSAIFQSLIGESADVRRVILTASGGPFLRTPKAQLEHVSVQQALNHPNWSMGAKITIDSSTMVNKGFEVIEARWLFGLPVEKIDVLVHPQSIVHSMVEFNDGAIKAQLGTPDMRLPIQFALMFPQRLDYGGGRLELASVAALTFEHVDADRFPALGLAYEALRRGGTAPCTMNAANEVAVAAFLSGRIGYCDICRLIQKALATAPFAAAPAVDDYARCDSEVRALVSAMI